jgi:phosphoribosylformylglycinamidine synthase
VIGRAKSADVPLSRLGATGGIVLALDGERPLRVDDLKHRFEAWLPAYMAGQT